MYKRLITVFLICAIMLVITVSAQEKADEKKLDFDDIQSAPDKVLNQFFEFFKKTDIENMKKVCVTELHEEIDKFALIKQTMPDLSFEFMVNEITTKEDFSIAITDILVTDKNETEINIAPISLKKLDGKWFIAKLDRVPEDAPDWAVELEDKLDSDIIFLQKFRKGQASPYFVVYEYMAALAEKDLETVKKLTITHEKLQKGIEEYMQAFEDGFKVKVDLNNIEEKTDFTVCELDLTFEEMDPKAIIMVLKNEGFKKYPSWKIIPLMKPELYLNEKSLNLPVWVQNRVKLFMDPKQAIKDDLVTFMNKLQEIEKIMLSGELDKLSEYFEESQTDMINELKTELSKITKFENILSHVKSGEALAVVAIEALEKNKTDAVYDEIPLSAKYENEKWTFSFKPDEKKMPWIDEVSELWRNIRINKDKYNYRPSSEFREVYDPSEFDNLKPKKNEAPEIILDTPYKGKIQGYSATNTTLNVEKAGVYRIVAENQVKEGDVNFNLTQNNINIGQRGKFAGYAAMEVYLIPGKYTIQFTRGFDSNSKGDVEFIARVMLLDAENLPELLPMIELNKEYTLENLGNDNGREGFIKTDEAGYYQLEFAKGGDDLKIDNDLSLTVDASLVPTSYNRSNCKIPSTKTLFMPKGLNKLRFSTWEKLDFPTKFTLKKVETIKSGDKKTVDVPQNAEVGWQFKLDAITKVSFELTGKAANNVTLTIIQKNSETQIQPSWGKNRAVNDILDPGIYMIKLGGGWDIDINNVTLTANLAAVKLAQAEPKFKSQTITGTKGEISGRTYNIDLTGYKNSKFVSIKVIDEETGKIIPESTINLSREAIEGTTKKEYVRMMTINDKWFANMTMSGKGYLYGYMLPVKHEMFLSIFAKVNKVRVEITLDDDVPTLEIGKFTNLTMKQNEIQVFKINIEKAMKLNIDTAFISEFGNVNMDVWFDGFNQNQFGGWMSGNGLSNRGLLTKGTYYVVIKRVARDIWSPTPELDELPIILSCLISYSNN